MSVTAEQSANVRRRRIIVLAPLVIFLGLASLFLLRLYAGDPSLIPSALIGHPVPQTALPPVAGLERDGTPIPGIPAPGGGYIPGNVYLHSFFGYFPAYDPKFIVFLFAVQPHGQEYASATLAQPFYDIAKYLINYYSIAPDR